MAFQAEQKMGTPLQQKMAPPTRPTSKLAEVDIVDAARNANLIRSLLGPEEQTVLFTAPNNAPIGRKPTQSQLRLRLQGRVRSQRHGGEGKRNTEPKQQQ